MTAIPAVVEHRFLLIRRNLRGLLVSGILTPLLFILAMGVGVGSLVDRNDGLDVAYLDFVAPGLMAALALQTAAFDSSWPVMGSFKWTRIYHGMASTRMTPLHIALGELAYIALRATIQASLFTLVITVVAGGVSATFPLAIPAATLCAVAFAAPMVALAATLETDEMFSVVFRLAVMPMFLFAGTFYPIDRLPEWAQWIAFLTPLWHGTELCRGAALGGLSLTEGAGHVGYLLVWVAAGMLLALWRYRKRLAS